MTFLLLVPAIAIVVSVLSLAALHSDTGKVDDWIGSVFGVGLMIIAVILWLVEGVGLIAYLVNHF